MLKLRTIGIRDYSVLESGQRIGRIRFAVAACGRAAFFYRSRSTNQCPFLPSESLAARRASPDQGGTFEIFSNGSRLKVCRQPLSLSSCW
jgi:hypothetical protein